jgi:isocitrate dehydrogenase (NAD+)
MTKVTVIPGDGIGPEITASVMKIIDATGADLEWEIVHAGEKVYDETETLIPHEVFESLERNKVGIKGPMTTPIGSGFRSANVALRKKYDLYANIRPARTVGQVKTLHENIDLVTVRENTEDLYAGVEEKISDNEMHSIKIITRSASERIIRKAFEYARAHNRKSVTVVTKANIMKLTDGMFLDIARETAQEFTEIKFKEALVDNMATQLVMNPNQFDVIVTQNLYGDILSDLIAGLVGGMGLVPGANMGDDMAIFEAVHGSAPDIAGKNMANPTALLQSGCMMLEYLNKKEEAHKIFKALETVLSDEKNFTRDLGGKATTSEFTEAIITALQNDF